MSDMAKQARAAMKAKAKSLTADRPLEKVESSSWTPPELLNADVKTGMRPISRRAYKSGGKVEGPKAAANMGKSVRSGNKPATADSLVNRNVKDANQEREGIKHIGGLKTGGRAKKMVGGPMAGAQAMMQRAQVVGDVPGATMNFSGIKKGSLSPMRATGMKKGGKIHDDVAADKALIKKMVKPAARTGKDEGGAADGDDGMKKGGRTARKEGGGVFTGPGYPGKVPGVVPGGRDAHARGGKAGKGKTNINILIGAGKPADMAPNPMGGPTPPPGGIPVPVPPPAGGPPGGAPMPMPMPMPGPAGPPGPPGMPMARKSGGRTYKSYKDMDAGAGSGEGRLEKAEIASRHPKVLPGNY
jgi:hypothetical protein